MYKYNRRGEQRFRLYTNRSCIKASKAQSSIDVTTRCSHMLARYDMKPASLTSHGDEAVWLVCLLAIPSWGWLWPGERGRGPRQRHEG